MYRRIGGPGNVELGDRSCGVLAGAGRLHAPKITSATGVLVVAGPLITSGHVGKNPVVVGAFRVVTLAAEWAVVLGLFDLGGYASLLELGFFGRCEEHCSGSVQVH